MAVLLALLPCLAVCVAVLALRWSGLAAATAAAATAIALWLTGVHSVPDGGQLGRALADAVVLTSIVAAMVLPGILFVEASRRRGSPEAIARLVGTLHLPPAQAAMLIAVGIGILVESLTGMGVSVLVSVPLLLTITERWRAIGLGLLGVSLMPWGALAISGLVGAKLAHVPIERFAWEVWTLSGPVAFSLPLLAWALMPGWAIVDAFVAAAVGLLFVGVIGLASTAIGIEIAGVAGGIAVTLALGALARREQGWRSELASPALRPYAGLIVAVALQKWLVTLLDARGLAPALSTGRITWSVLTSPGVALLAATAVILTRDVDFRALRVVAERGWRAMAGVAMFMLSARLLVEIGAIETLAGAVSGLGARAAVVAVALLGGVSGFVTGSGITGNALFMPSAAAVGHDLSSLELFSALQNSAAGHFAMASLPVAAILMATLPQRRHGDDRLILVVALGLAVSHLTVLIASAMLRCHWLGPC